MTPMKWFWGYMKKYSLKMAVGLVLLTITSLLAMVNPKLTGIIVDDIIGDGRKIELKPLLMLLGIMIAITVIRSVLRLIFLWQFETASQSMLYDMRDGVYRNLLQKDFAFYNKTRTGDLMARQTGDMMAIRHFVAFVIYNIYENVMLFIIALIMIFMVDWRIAVCMVAVLPFTAFNTYCQSKSIKPKFTIVRNRFSSLNAFTQENISGNRVVKAFAKEDYEIEKFDRENDAYREAELGAATIWERHVPIFEFLSNMLLFVLMLVGGIMVIKGTMTLGNMVMINGYLWMLNNPLRMAGWLTNDLFRFITSVEKIYSTIQEVPKISSPKQGWSPERLKGSVEFKHVSYRMYDDVILQDISFEVKQGWKVGIIGATGSGKSTIMNLMCRFFDATEGRVKVGGVNVKKLDLHTLRDSIGMAMQDVFLFSDTIEGNIAYGKPDCSFEEVVWAAKIAGAHDFIMQMPDGYNTIVGERGMGLSGGQKQRISLARALLKKPSIVILDDTTSAVDMETEAQIQNALQSVDEQQTVFIIAHRISSIKDADMILVLNDGKIVERGNHDTLMEQKGYYYTVFSHQYGEFDKFRHSGKRKGGWQHGTK